MPIIIKEIRVKTTVEKRITGVDPEQIIPELKKDILRELQQSQQIIGSRKRKDR